RYRGYVYDSETGLYYLQSRYYDPETGRFLNADDVDYIGISGTVISFNSFAYCGNNPIMYVDPTGYGRTYVIYYNNPGSGFYAQAMNSPYYNRKSKNVYMISVTSNQDFINAWNSMSGTIDYVYLYLHGDKGFLYFKD
ncbi:MAG: RHS repeat-associated core domain-containing protein, partial [Clostridia bacterium]|nr:RHS repeat-associated core domain-containing protein [Clostridia bacterium]